MLTVILVVCGIWAIGCVALVFMVLRAGSLCDDESWFPSSTDTVPSVRERLAAASRLSPKPMSDSEANRSDPEGDACAPVGESAWKG